MEILMLLDIVDKIKGNALGILMTQWQKLVFEPHMQSPGQILPRMKKRFLEEAELSSYMNETANDVREEMHIMKHNCYHSKES